jgi:uncharacterized protein (DUF58 family)
VVALAGPSARLESEPALAVLTPRGRALVLASAVMLALGLFIRAPLSGALIAAGTFALLLAYISKLSLELRLHVVGSLRVRREFEGEMVEGSRLKVRLVLENPSIVPLENVEVHDYYPSLFRLLEASNMRTLLVPPKGYAMFEYAVKPVVGRHRFPNPLLVVRDPFGLFSKALRIQASSEVAIQPRYERIHGRNLLVIPSAKPGGLSGARRRGVGTQFFEVREYQYGDEIRRIEWKSTARLLKLMVKEFEQESSLEVAVVIDTSPSMTYGRVGYTKLEYSVRAAATIGEYLARRGDYVGLAYHNPGSGVVVVPPGRGHGHFRLYVRALSRISWPGAGGRSPERGDNRLVEAVSRYVGASRRRGKTVFILFSDLELREEQLAAVLDVLSKIRGLGHEVFVLSPATPFFEVKSLTGLQAGLYRLKALDEIARRRRIAKLFLSRGIPMVSVGPDDLAIHALRRIEVLRQVLL